MIRRWCFLWASTDFLCFVTLISVAACRNDYTDFYILFLKDIPEFIDDHHFFIYLCSFQSFEFLISRLAFVFMCHLFSASSSELESLICLSMLFCFSRVLTKCSDWLFDNRHC